MFPIASMPSWVETKSKVNLKLQLLETFNKYYGHLFALGLLIYFVPGGRKPLSVLAEMLALGGLILISLLYIYLNPRQFIVSKINKFISLFKNQNILSLIIPLSFIFFCLSLYLLRGENLEWAFIFEQISIIIICPTVYFLIKGEAVNFEFFVFFYIIIALLVLFFLLVFLSSSSINDRQLMQIGTSVTFYRYFSLGLICTMYFIATYSKFDLVFVCLGSLLVFGSFVSAQKIVFISNTFLMIYVLLSKLNWQKKVKLLSMFLIGFSVFYNTKYFDFAMTRFQNYYHFGGVVVEGGPTRVGKEGLKGMTSISLLSNPYFKLCMTGKLDKGIPTYRDVVEFEVSMLNISQFTYLDRGILFLEALRQTFIHPWIGNGIHTFACYLIVSDDFYTRYYYTSPHNFIFNLLCETGLIGLFIFCIAMFYVAKQVYSSKNRNTVFLFNALLIYFLISSSTSWSYYDFRYFWLFGFVCMAHIKLSKDQTMDQNLENPRKLLS